MVRVRTAKVTVRFLGLRQLNVIHDKLEHGAEITYRRRLVHSVEKARKLVRPRSKLAIFAPRPPNRGPDFVDTAIRAKLDSLR